MKLSTNDISTEILTFISTKKRYMHIEFIESSRIKN